jgi:serine/threonine protein phosphatase PrpC
VKRVPDEEAFAAWTQGQRERQEDSFRLLRLDPAEGGGDRLLLLVADGMGGQAAGNLASDVAAETFVSHAKATDVEAAATDLQECLHEANEAIRRRTERDPGLEGMGTTLLAVAIDENVAHWISVGDSILYTVRQGKLTRMNADHSLAGLHDEMARRGEITPEEAERRGGHNQLRSALMGTPIPLIDHSDAGSAIHLQKGDVLVLASDGILSLSTAAISQLIAKAKGSARTIAEGLVEAVNAAKIERQDNATVVAYVHPGRAARERGGKIGFLVPVLVTVIVAALAIAWAFSYLDFPAGKHRPRHVSAPSKAG